MGSSHNKKTNSDLIAEQPGWSWSLLGIFVAIFLGLSLRATFSSERVRGHLQRAASKVHADISISFENAYVSLADGIWPELAVVIHDMQMQSSQNCWLAPSLEANEIKLPLDLWQLLKGKVHIHQVLVDEVNVLLRSDLSSCQRETALNSSPGEPTDNGNINSPKKADVMGRLPAQQSAAPAFIKTADGFVSTKSPIDNLQIKLLKVHYLPLNFTSFEIKDFEMILKSQESRDLAISGVLNLGGETLSGDYSSQANINVSYSEKEYPLWILKIGGNWREGQYELSSEYRPKNQRVTMDVLMKHIPLSQMIPLLKKYKLMNQDFNGKQIWISSHAKAVGVASDLKKLPLDVDFIKVEGDIGEVSTKDFRIHSLDPFEFDPIQINIHDLNFDQLLVFLGRSHPNPTLGKLGIFNGEALLRPHEKVQIRGQLSGLEFIFSNRGVRQAQPLGYLSGSLEFNGQRWKGNIYEAKPVEGIFIGNVDLESDRDWKNLSLRAKVDELSFGSAVQKLMTGGGDLGIWSGEVSTEFSEGQLKDIRGILSNSQMLVENNKFIKSKISIATQSDQIQVDLRVQQIMAYKGSPILNVLQPFLDPKILNLDSVNAQSLNARLQTHSLKDLTWKNFAVDVNRTQIRSEGGYDDQGRLSGQLTLVRSGNKAEKWEISGHRDQPKFTRK